jgi:hypothetical protein
MINPDLVLKFGLAVVAIGIIIVWLKERGERRPRHSRRH